MAVSETTLDAQPIGTASPSAETGGVLTIDLAAVEANWKRLAGMSVPAECAAVVKADGYGCGLEVVTARLAKAGCRTFFVADLSEGRRARAVAPEAVIYVLSGVLPGAGTWKRQPSPRRRTGSRPGGCCGRGRCGADGMARVCGAPLSTSTTSP